MTRIVSFSDTHGSHFGLKVPDGDILVCAGDLCAHGGMRDTQHFLNWFNTFKHPHKVFIAGNHDRIFEQDPGIINTLIRQLPKNLHYLQDNGVEIEGLKFWGSPVSPRFYNWSFNRDRGEDIKRHWDMIPEATDVLITHGPPHGICDEAYRPGYNITEHTGCADLMDAVLRIAPKLHLFGHIHYSGGQTYIGLKTTYANVSVLDESYQVVREPMIFDIDNDKTVSIMPS
jgi:Icc-related predicted phosphoesterase